MSTFGEINEPGSRTAWEDWDEICPETNIAELQWQKVVDPPEKIDVFYIFEGKFLADFIMQTIKLKHVNSISNIKLNLYELNITEYICLIEDYNLLHSSEIVELLKPYVSICHDVIGTQTKPLSQYHSTALNEEYFVIRSISTTKAVSKTLNINYPKLEQPNIVSGVLAGVLCLREHMGRSGMGVIWFFEHPGEMQIEEIQELLKNLKLPQESNSRLTSVLDSNLYI